MWQAESLSVQPAPALGERVVNHLRRMIVLGELAAGTHLVESQLSATFNVSRGPIRDALRQLEVEGLVEARRRGVFVIGLSSDDVEELYSLRQVIEAEVVSLCITRQDCDLAPAHEALRVMEAAADAGDSDAFAEADLAFHSAFYGAAGHRRLAAIWEQYRPTFTTMLSLTNAEDRDLHPTYRDHVDLLDQVCGRDAESALSSLRDHIEGSRGRLLAAYTRSRGTDPV